MAIDLWVHVINVEHMYLAVKMAIDLWVLVNVEHMCLAVKIAIDCEFLLHHWEPQRFRCINGYRLSVIDISLGNNGFAV